MVRRLLLVLLCALVLAPVGGHGTPAGAATKKKTTATSKKKSRRTPKPVPSPARPRSKPKPKPKPQAPRPEELDDKPLPITSLPPSPGKDLTADEINEQREQLNTLRAEARRLREQAERVRGKERGVAQDLKRIERNLAVTQRYIRELEARERIVSGQRRLTEMNLKDAIERRENQRGTLAWRLREVYKFGLDRRLESLVSSQSFAQLIERTDFFARILDSDRELLADIHQQTQRIDANRRALVATGQQLALIADEKEQETKRLGSLRDEQKATMTTLQKERQSYESRARQNEQAAARIQSLIATLEKRRREREAAARAAKEAGKPPAPEDTWLLNAEFAKNKGNLPWPVRGDIIGTFGRNTNPRFNTVTINNGVDISAPVGTPVQAVAKGRVEVSESLPGFGRTVILNHGDGYYTIYANCGSVSVGVNAQVDARQTIATVGNVDASRGPFLHFEVRKGKQALNPTGWLR